MAQEAISLKINVILTCWRKTEGPLLKQPHILLFLGRKSAILISHQPLFQTDVNKASNSNNAVTRHRIAMNPLLIAVTRH